MRGPREQVQIKDCPRCEGPTLQRATPFSRGCRRPRLECAMERVRKPAPRISVALQPSGTGLPPGSGVVLPRRGCAARAGVEIALPGADWERGPETSCRNHP